MPTTELIPTSIQQHFIGLKAPSIDPCKRHGLLDICAVIRGTDEWAEIEAFGKATLTRFHTFLNLLRGIPSHNTFGRVFP